MKNRLIDDAILREYLLGRLEADEELVEHIDQQMLTDPEFSTSVDIVEDEIIEEYLEGALDEADKHAVKSYFLRPPERQGRLRTARLIQRHFSSPTPGAVTQDRMGPTHRARILRMPKLPAWSAIAAAVLLTACLFSLWRQHRRLDSLERANLQLKDQNRELLARNETPTAAADVYLHLSQGGLSRGADSFTNLDLPASADKVHVDIALLVLLPGPYRITLLHNDAVAWTDPSVKVTPVADGGVVRFDIPAIAIPEGTCKVVLKSLSGDEIDYRVTVRRL